MKNKSQAEKNLSQYPYKKTPRPLQAGGAAHKGNPTCTATPTPALYAWRTQFGMLPVHTKGV